MLNIIIKTGWRHAVTPYLAELQIFLANLKQVTSLLFLVKSQIISLIEKINPIAAFRMTLAQPCFK